MSTIKTGKYTITESGKKVQATVLDVKPQGRGHTVTYRTADGRQASVSASGFNKLLAA